MKSESWKKSGLAIGLVAFLSLWLLYDPVSGRPEVGKMAAIAVLMAVLWISEAIPLAATALIPIVAFP